MQRVSLAVVLLLCTAAAAATPVKIVHDSSALKFTYQWPAEAAAVPALDRRFRREAAKAYRRQLALALEDKKLYQRQGRGSVGDFYSRKWSTAGESSRLLSLEYEHSAYTGGAHPNTDYGALVWDRRLAREIGIDSLFVQRRALQQRTRGAYCKALDRERAKRRGKDARVAVPEFNACPDYSDLAIAPVDSNNNGRFDAIDFVASPYLAGPYVEGAYSIAVPVTPDLIALLKPEYRSSFEAHRPQ